MIMKIFSKYGKLDCEPMTLQDIECSVKEELQAEEIINSSVTADDQEDPRSASDSC